MNDVWAIEAPIYVPASDFIVTVPGVYNAISGACDQALLLCPPGTAGAVQVDLNDKAQASRIIVLVEDALGHAHCEPYAAPAAGTRWVAGGCYVALETEAYSTQALGVSVASNKVILPLHDAEERVREETSLLPF